MRMFHIALITEDVVLNLKWFHVGIEGMKHGDHSRFRTE